MVCIFTNRMRRLDLAGGECGGLIVGVAADLRRGRLELAGSIVGAVRGAALAWLRSSSRERGYA